MSWWTQQQLRIGKPDSRLAIIGKLALTGDAEAGSPLIFALQDKDAGVRCAVMQGGQGEVKHWAFNDPLKRAGKFKDSPPSPAEYRKLKTRVVDLHPMTIIQNARTSGGGS